MAEDLDLELLELVGRGASGKKRGRSNRSDSDASSGGSSSDSDGPRRGRGRQSKQQRGRRDESSDDDSKSGEDVFSDGYGSDLYGDDEDRERLEAMTELEREMILADRAEKRDQARQRKEILQRAKNAEKPGAAKGQRTSSRQKKASGGKDSAIKKIEAARKRQDKGSKASKGRRRGSDDSGGDDDEYGDSERERDRRDESDEEGLVRSEEEDAGPGRRPTTRATAGATQEEEPDQRRRLPDEEEDDEHLPGVRRHTYDADEYDDRGGDMHMDDEETADHSELRSIQLTRTQLETMYDKPFFEGEGLTGAVIRIAFGGHNTNKDGVTEPNYWMMQIVSIKESSTPYPFGPKGTPCFKKLEVRDGMRHPRVMAMASISNKPLTDDEIERFNRHTHRIKERPITKQQVAEIKQKIQNAINYRWGAAQVKEMLAKKREAGRAPVNMTVEKSRLQRLLEGERSKQPPDYDKIAELESQIKAIDEKINKPGTQGPGGGATALSAINERNKKANFNQTIRGVSNRPVDAPGQRKAGGADPFSRRETRPSIYWNTSGSKKAAESAEAVAQQAEAAAAKPPPTDTNPLKASMARLDPVDLVKMLDLNIDVTPLQDCSIVPPLHLKLLGPRWHQSLTHHTNFDLAGRTLLTMHDWQQRAQQ